MSIKQAILNTSGFFSITSLQHKMRAQSRGQSGIRGPGLWAARLRGAQSSHLKRDFVHCRGFPVKLQGGQAAPLVPLMKGTLR